MLDGGLPIRSPAVKRSSCSVFGSSMFPFTALWLKEQRGCLRVVPGPAFVPLFPGYVFLCANEEQRAEAFRTKCVVRIIEAPDKSELIFDLRQVQQLIASDAPLSPEARLVRGMKVRIRSGPFAGIEGSVIKRRGKDMLLVAVNFLQRGASVVVGDYETERIE